MARITVSATIICIVTAAGYALAQPGRQSQIRESSSHYNVSSVGNSAVLIDTKSSRTWLLKHSVDPTDNSVWIPITRLDSDEAVRHWQDKEAARKSQLAEEESDAVRTLKSVERGFPE